MRFLSTLPKQICLASAAVLFGSIQLIKAQTPAKKHREKLNIVLFVADDLGARDIKAYGNKVVQTPNIDKLKSQSVLFTRAFASSPTCAPSRASLHTGLMSFRDGAHANHTGIKDGVKTLPFYMKELGYEAGLAGKLHLGPLNLYPYDLIHHTNVPEPGHEKQGALWTDLNMDPVDEWLGKKATSQTSFVLVVNDHSPHVIWPEKAIYDPARVDIPEYHVDTPETRESRARYYTDISKMDGNVGKLLASLEKYHLDENTVVVFTADQGPQWAFGKWNLYDYGLQVPLLIRWPGVVKPGSSNDALVSLVDILPTLIDISGGKPSEDLDGRSLKPLLQGDKVALHDCIYASHTGDGTTNQSPMRMIRDKKYKYILNLVPDNQFHTHIDRFTDHNEYWPSWVEQSFKNEHAAAVLWRYHNRTAEELYDLEADPNEQVNLAQDPKYKSLLDDFRSKMNSWRNQQGDKETGIFTEPEEKGKTVVAPYIFE